MSKDFLKSANFKTRATTGFLLVIVVILSMVVPYAIAFRVFFAAAGIMAALELHFAYKTQAYRDSPLTDDRVLVLEYIVIAVAVYAISFYFERKDIVLVTLGAVSTDIFAYFIGSACHDTIFIARPFPKTSPKKTWEGIIGGFLGCIITVLLTILIMRLDVNFSTACFVLICPIIAISGDFLASFCKRFLRVKDSGDCINNSTFELLKLLETFVEGHGGYLDRIDSISAVACLLFCIKLASK